MDTISIFLKAVDAYCAATGISEATASTRILNDGKRLTALRVGADIGTRRIERAMQWLSDNWPEGAEWPEGVPRPKPTPEAAA